MATKYRTEDLDRIGFVLRPGQTIASDKLHDATNGAMSVWHFYAAKREMQRRGMLTEKLRRGCPSMLTFHNPPLPEDKRVLPVTKRKGPKDAEQSNGAVAVNPDRLEKLIVRLRAKELKIEELKKDIAQIKSSLASILL